MKKLIIIIIVLFISATVNSQTDTSKEVGNIKFKKVVKEKIMEKLGIDENTANTFIKLSAAHRQKINDFNKQRSSIMYYIENNVDASDIESKIEDLLEIETKITNARKDYFTDLKKILTPKQIAQAIVFQKNLQKLMKKEINKLKRDNGD